MENTLKLTASVVVFSSNGSVSVIFEDNTDNTGKTLQEALNGATIKDDTFIIDNRD